MGDKEIDSIIRIWQEWAGRQQGPDMFILNPDKERVERLANGILNNEKIHGLKYCPCRMTTGRREDDLKLICPCNFKMQKTWNEKGECWCSLFMRKK